VSTPRPLSASLEDYLEAIYHVVAANQVARAKDIAARLQVSGSSVTGALHALAKREFINYTPYDVITLTPEGHRVAQDVVRRHRVLRTFFTRVLDVAEDEADEAACRMEHAVPRLILERFVAFAESHGISMQKC
jgi:DtxR family transcriptional regulator, Mn-dependent transcriptional regulator